MVTAANGLPAQIVTNDLPLCTQIIVGVAEASTLEALATGRMTAAFELRTADVPAPASPPLAQVLADGLTALQAQYAAVQQDPLPLVEAEALWSRLPPEQRKRLRFQSKMLVDRLQRRLPPAAGETIVASDVACLRTGWNGYEAGTIVCLQQSNLGTIASLFPRVVFDTEQLRLTERAVSQPNRFILSKAGPPKPPHARPVLYLAVTGASPGMGKAFLTFATTAAFAIPAPWGVLISGGLSVFQMFLGSEGKTDTLADTVKSALQESVKAMRAAITEAKIKDAMAAIEAEMDWVATTFTAIKALGDDRNGASSFVNDTLTKINGSLGPENRVAFYFQEMKQIANEAKTDLVIRDQAFDVMVTLAGLHLTFMKLRVQLKSWQNLEAADDTFYAWYDEFVEQTNGSSGYVATVSQALDTLKQDHATAIDARVKQVGDLAFYDKRTMSFGEPGGLPLSIREGDARGSYWYFVDAGLAGDHQWHDTVVEHNDCAFCVTFDDVQHRDEAENGRTAYVADLRNGLTAELNTRLADVTTGLATWKSNAEAWRDNKPPRTPTAAPVISATWKAAVPHGANWVKGAKVRYAAAFKNAKGGTPPGPWTEYTAVGDHACPLLTGVPVDTIGIAKSRSIHRQFEGKPATLVGVIPDNTTTTFQDDSE